MIFLFQLMNKIASKCKISWILEPNLLHDEGPLTNEAIEQYNFASYEVLIIFLQSPP